MAYPAQVTNHVAAAQARLLVEYQQSPNLQGLIGVFAARVQLIENALYAVMTQRALSTASGQQLDNLGKIIGLLRSSVPGGNVDAVYAIWLRVQILVNASTGSAPNLIAICLMDGDAGTAPKVFDSGPASCIVRVTAAITSQPSALSAALQSARAAGIHLVTEYLSTGTPSTTYTYDGTPAQALDNGTFNNSI